MASAGVAGALIGLLFVAVSVVPHAVRTSDRATAKLRPSVALSAFMNALFVSLLALAPGVAFGRVVTALSLVGLVAGAVLLVLLLREVRTTARWSLVRALVTVVGLGVVFGFEFAQGLALRARPGDVGALDNLAVLIVVLFALGIERAWEYVGASTPGPLSTLLATGRRRPVRDGGGDGGDGGDGGGGNVVEPGTPPHA